MQKEFEKEETTDILENLERRKKIKRFLVISIISVILIIIIFISFSAYFYFKSPEKTLGVGANIESVLLNEQGNLVYVKLLGGSLDKNITKIKFIFTDEQGKEYVYETSEGIQQIEVPYSRSFWDWLFGRQFIGVYDYEISSEDLGLDNFENIDEVSVVFEYKTGTGEIIETPRLDTTKPTTKTTTGGGGGGTTTQPSCTPTKTCADYIGQCSSSLSDGCSDSLDCSGNCGSGEICNASGMCVVVQCTSDNNCTIFNNIRNVSRIVNFSECVEVNQTSQEYKNYSCVLNLCQLNATTNTTWQNMSFINKTDGISCSFGSCQGGACVSGCTPKSFCNAGECGTWNNGTCSGTLNCGGCGSGYTCSSPSNGSCVFLSCTNDSGCLSTGSFCDDNNNIPYNCSLGSDGCLDRVNGSECGSGYYCSDGECLQGNVYYVSQLEACNDSWEGNSTHPWCNLSRAYTWYSGSGTKVQEGDTVLFRNGSYGIYSESDVNRTNWVTYRAAEGHHPVLTRIFLYNVTVYDAYLIFDGFNIRPGDLAAWTYGVRVTKSNHVHLYNLDVEGCEGIDMASMADNGGHSAVFITYSDDVIVNNCKIYTNTTSKRYGFSDGIYLDSSTNIEVNGCDVSGCWALMAIGGGNYVNVKNCNLHDPYSDGIVFKGCNNLTIENNKIHGLYVYVPTLTETPTETTWNEAGTIMNNSDANWNTPGDTRITTRMQIMIVSGANSLIGGDDLQIQDINSDGTQITLSRGIAHNGTPYDVNYYIVADSHTDLIQAGAYALQSNIIIRGNQCYDTGGQIWHIAPWVDAGTEPNHCGGSNFLMENNLLWGSYVNEEYAHWINMACLKGSTLRNNILIGHLRIWDHSSFQMYNNIISYLDCEDTAGSIVSNYNIANRAGIDTCCGNAPGVNDTFLHSVFPASNWNDPAFTGIFADYANGDFRPLINSIACNGSVNPVGVAVGALPCVCTNNSQCEQVFGSQYICDIPIGNCCEDTNLDGVCDILPTLSPFTNLWNFLKGLLTGKTGNAILTGKTITGDAAGDGSGKSEYEKPLIIFVIAVIIIGLIVIIIKARKIKKRRRRK